MLPHAPLGHAQSKPLVPVRRQRFRRDRMHVCSVIQIRKFYVWAALDRGPMTMGAIIRHKGKKTDRPHQPGFSEKRPFYR